MISWRREWLIHEAYSNSLHAPAAKSLQSCPTLCDPIDGSPPGSPVPRILQARTRVGCHFLPQCIKVKSESEVAQSCPTLSNPMDCSPPGSSIYGIFQARVLEWGAIAFSNINYWDSLNKQITQVLYDLLLKYSPWTSSTGITWELEMKTLRPRPISAKSKSAL